MKNKIFNGVITLILLVVCFGITGCGKEKEYVCIDPQLTYEYNSKITTLLLYEYEDIKEMPEDTKALKDTKEILLKENEKDLEKVGEMSTKLIQLVYKDELTEEDKDYINECYIKQSKMIKLEDLEYELDLIRINNCIS